MLKKLCIALISSLFSILSIDSNETLAQCSVTLGNNFSVCNGQEITLDAQVTGGTGNYSYSWSNSSDTGPSRTFIPTGDQTQNVSQTYSVTVTDPGGCFATASVTVNVMSTPSASMVVTDNSCTIIGGVEFSFPNHPNRSAIEFSVNGGGSYLASIPDNSGSVFYMLNPGTYHAFSRWGNNQCPADLGTFTIADDGTGISLDIGPNFTICDGQPVTITPIVTGGTGALTYSWSATDGSESGTGLTFTPTGSSTANINKFYDVKVIDENGCTAEDQVRITLESSPSATTILTQSSCNSIGGIEFTFPDHSSRTGIEFSTSGNSNYYSNVPDNSGSIFYALAPGDYHAYARWGNNECPVDLGEFTITDDGSSITLDAGPDIISCHGEEITLNTTITGGTGPYNYTWESTDGLDSGTGSTFTPLGSATQNLIKDYNIHITDDNGCVASDQIRIRIFSAPSASFTVSGNSCNTLGGIEFSFANHPNRTNIRFSVNGDTNYFPSILDNSGSIFYNLTPGSYHAFVKWGGGSTCPVDLGEFTVLDDGTAVYLDAGPDISVCNGDSFTISPTVTGGTLPHSYSWSSTDGLESGTGLTITPLGSPTQNLNRTYTITITDANGCINVDEISVGILSFPNVTNITTEAGCGTDAQVSLEFENHQNRSALEFSFNNGSSYLSQVLDNSGSITYNMAPGTFPTFVRWGNNQCPLSLGNITLESKEISLQMGGDVTICNEDEINFSPTVSDATEPYSYAWTNGSDSGTGLTLTPQGTNNSNSAYSYTFTVTDAEGCTDSDNLEVSILSNPTATVFSSAADCDGDAEVLFEFPDHPNFAGIAFSLDGGVTYESPLLDNSGSVSYSRPEGVYSTYIQWYDGTCPVEIGEAEIAGGSVFLSAASGNASDAIWTIPGSSNLFSIDFCEDRSLVITDGTSVMADLDIEAENITVENTGSLDMSANNHILGIYGDFTNNGDFQAQQGRVRLIGSQPQNIAGDFVKFHDVEILNIFNVSLQTTMQTNGTIYPNLGIFDINGNKLTLVSEPVGSEILTGSIAEIGPFSDVVGEIELERYVSSLEDGFRYMGIPIQGQTVADFEGDFVTTGFTGSDYPNHWYTNVKYIDETDRVAGDTDSGYKDVNSTTDLIDSSKGYIGYFPPSTTANLLNADGPFNKGDMSFNLSYTDLGTPSEDGWHLIPNPYPSAIDIMSPDITFNNVDRAIYIIDHELGSDWKGEYVVYNNGVSINGATNIVASYQAFLVKANGPGASITFRESSKSMYKYIRIIRRNARNTSRNFYC